MNDRSVIYTIRSIQLQLKTKKINLWNVSIKEEVEQQYFQHISNMGGGGGIGSGASIAPSPTHSESQRKKGFEEKKIAPPVGLKNVGNTCYANAALQCILSTALSHALLDPQSTTVFRRYSSNPGLLALGSGSVDSFDTEDGNQESRKLAREKAREIRRQNREKMLKHEKCQWLTGQLTDITRIYTASTLNFEEENASSWQGIFHLFSEANNQRIVDPGGVTRHVNKISTCLRPYQQEDAHEFLRALLSTLTQDGHNKRLSSLCDGLLESAVTCQTCHRASITRDRYMDLSLDIHGDIQDLTGALNNFTQPELLDKDNKVTCSRCKTKRIVSKGLRLATAPSVLVCHLKRFAFDIYGRATRLSKHVKYPLRLEIGDFMSRANQSKPPPYELVGVLVHAGRSCERGHYLAFIKSGDSWYKANDEVVTKVDIDTVLRQQAYILFYEVEGMRVRNGYQGFRKYHKSNSDTGNSDCSNDEQPTTSLSSLLDSMLHLCGSVESVRDAICDTDKSAKKKKDSDGLESVSTCSSANPSLKSRSRNKKSKRRRDRDSVFRTRSEVPYSRVRSSSEEPRGIIRDNVPTISRDHMQSHSGDQSHLSVDSRMIRSVSSNNIFEKEEEAIHLYEKESYNVVRPRGQNRRSVSPNQYRHQDYHDARKIKPLSAQTARPTIVKRKSYSAPRTRSSDDGLATSYSPALSKATDVKLPPLHSGRRQY